MSSSLLLQQCPACLVRLTRIACEMGGKLKRKFFQAVVVSVLLYGCTTWTLTKRLENKLDGSCTRILRAVLNKTWKQHPTRKQLYGHLPRISQAIRVRRTKHAGHCWRSKDELISDVLLWKPTHGHASVGAQQGLTLTSYAKMLAAQQRSSQVQ